MKSTSIDSGIGFTSFKTDRCCALKIDVVLFLLFYTILVVLS